MSTQDILINMSCSDFINNKFHEKLDKGKLYFLLTKHESLEKIEKKLVNFYIRSCSSNVYSLTNYCFNASAYKVLDSLIQETSTYEDINNKHNKIKFLLNNFYTDNYEYNRLSILLDILLSEPLVVILYQPYFVRDSKISYNSYIDLLMRISSYMNTTLVITTSDTNMVHNTKVPVYFIDSDKVEYFNTSKDFFESKSIEKLSSNNTSLPFLLNLQNKLKDSGLNIKPTNCLDTIVLQIKNMITDNKSFYNGKLLKKGFTTGSCATAAATAACIALITGEEIFDVLIHLPSDKTAFFKIEGLNFTENSSECYVYKDAGDDPDVTHGCKVVVKCEFSRDSTDIKITGGEGIGFVTEDGLCCPKGSYAINPVPCSMIKKNLELVKQKYSCTSGFKVTISIPGGENLAKKTFNSKLGIINGLSILGTTGIVEPMSQQAIIETIKNTLNIQRSKSEYVLITPGNYGRDFCINNYNFDIDNAVKFSNYLGDTIDYIVFKKFRYVLVAGHIGKLVKVAGGIMNTHSKVADCRFEIFAAYAAKNGASTECIDRILSSNTTIKVLQILKKEGLKQRVIQSLAYKIIENISVRACKSLSIGLVIFEAEDKELFTSENAIDIINKIKGVFCG